MPLERAKAPISLIGITVPISLFAYIIVIKIVSGLIAASTAATLTIPYSSTGK